MFPVICGRLAGDFSKNPIKMSERLKADFKCNFTDVQVRVEQKIFRFFNADASDVFCEIESGRLFEHFAEVKAARVYRLRHLAQRELIRLMFEDEMFGASNNR